MEEPNHFPQLLEIARQLPAYPWDEGLSKLFESPPDQWPTDEEVDAQIAVESPIYLAKHANTIEAARKLTPLPGMNCVPPTVEAYRNEHLQNQMAAKQLGDVFARSAMTAAAASDWRAAISDVEHCFRLSLAMRRGGLIVDYLIASIIEGGGIWCLRKNRRRFPVELQRELIPMLEAHDAAREPYDDIADRDEAWTAANPSVNGDPSAEYEPPPSMFGDIEIIETEPSPAEKARQAAMDAQRSMLYSGTPEEVAAMNRRHMQEADLRNIALLRLLRIELALLAYHTEHGLYPRRLCALVPRYLCETPGDPHAVKPRPFQYRRQGGEFLLYGRDTYGVDHGGQQSDNVDFSFGLADLFLDMHDLPAAEEVSWPPPSLLGRWARLLGISPNGSRN